MDAVKFLEERKRMFKSGKAVPNLGVDVTYNSEKVVKIVEEWSAAHPRKTRQSVFLERWPEARVDAYGVLDIDPCLLLKRYKYGGEDICNDVDNCFDCRREFWMQEVE